MTPRRIQIIPTTHGTVRASLHQDIAGEWLAWCEVAGANMTVHGPTKREAVDALASRLQTYRGRLADQAEAVRVAAVVIERLGVEE